MIMLKAFSKINSVHTLRIGLGDTIVSNVRASTNIYHNLTNHRELIYRNQKSFTQQTPKQHNTAKNETYKEDFEKLKKEHQKKDSNEKKHKDSKDGNLESLNSLKQNVFVNLKFGKDMQQDPLAEQLKQEKLKQEAVKDENTDKSAKQPETTEEKTLEQEENIAKTATKTEEKSHTESHLTKQPTLLNKMVDYIKETMEETFPSEKYERKKSLKKALAKKQKMVETVEYTEEELEKIQQEIPEWKSKSLINLEQERQEKETLAKKLKGKIKERINKTSVAQKVYSSEEYKDYEEFRKNMTQFKSDLKDHMHQSQNPLIQGSVSLIDKVKSESNTAKAIIEMKKMDPSFDIYELERDAAGIFNDVYTAYLEGDLEKIEKQCGDMALGYFKVLLKKREADKVEPKFKELWHVEPADLIGGQIPENKYPMFTFTIRTQEIYCNVSLKDQKIVEGSEDRLMYCQYNFVLTPHQNPDLEEIGHGWELVELTQVGNLAALV